MGPYGQKMDGLQGLARVQIERGGADICCYAFDFDLSSYLDEYKPFPTLLPMPCLHRHNLDVLLPSFLLTQNL